MNVEFKIIEVPGDHPTVQLAIAELAWAFAQVHIGDNDELGEKARELWSLLEAAYPALKPE